MATGIRTHYRISSILGINLGEVCFVLGNVPRLSYTAAIMDRRPAIRWWAECGSDWLNLLNSKTVKGWNQEAFTAAIFILLISHIVSTSGVKKRKCTGRCHLMQSLSSQVKSLMQNAVKVSCTKTDFQLTLFLFFKNFIKKTQVKMLQYELIFCYSKLMQIFKPCIKDTVLLALLINAYKNVENYLSIRWKTELTADKKKIYNPQSFFHQNTWRLKM